MRLLSATVRNYRIHGETSVDFTDALTLIGGKNESGKSTLAEAIHRALFLKATTGGKAHEEMQSSIHPGHPEVEVCFEAAGSTWHLTKRFAKGSGKTTLREEGGETLHGPEAETRLAELLQVEEPGGGAGGVNRAKTQWAHLWVWQGAGGDDPSPHASGQRDALLSRLEDQGGGAAMQSELDATVAARFQTEYDRLFTAGGKVKAGSPLQKAEEEREAAAAALQQGEEAFARLDTAARQVREAEAALAGGDQQLETFRRELSEARGREKEAASFRHQIEQAEQKMQTATKAVDDFRQTTEEIDGLREQIRKLESSTAAGAVKEAEETLSTLRRKAQEAGGAAEEAETAHADAQVRRELAEAWGHLLKHQEDLANLQAKQKEVAALEKKKQEIDESLARLPAIDESTYRGLQAAEKEAERGAAVLEAMSTGVEVVKASTALRVGEETLTAGDNRVLDRETEISIGDACTLRITPGGGDGLEQARAAFRKAQRSRDEVFRGAGVTDLKEAGEVRAQRLAREASKSELDRELAGQQADQLEKSLADTSRELATCEEEVKRRTPLVKDFSPPETADAARELWAGLRDRVTAAAEAAATASSAVKSLRAEVEAAEEALEAARDLARKGEQQLQEARTTLAIKSEPLGPQEERPERLAALEKSREEAKATVDALREQLAGLLPESIEADIARLTRAEAEKNAALSSARERRAEASALLRNDGTLDPSATLAAARARVEEAEERWQSVERHASAIRLLRDLFTEEQQQLSEQFSQPLADAVTGYLRQIFGPDARADVSIDDGNIGEWRMSRSGETFHFDDLSGGTREQVAAAVRLAIAELLSADHGGTLPIVFDDAFTNSDPERIRSLHRMLDLASRNGVQVVVLTCTPAEYEGLGAKTVLL